MPRGIVSSMMMWHCSGNKEVVSINSTSEDSSLKFRGRLPTLKAQEPEGSFLKESLHLRGELAPTQQWRLRSSWRLGTKLAPTQVLKYWPQEPILLPQFLAPAHKKFTTP
jgi:hypothetical protein